LRWPKTKRGGGGDPKG